MIETSTDNTTSRFDVADKMAALLSVTEPDEQHFRAALFAAGYQHSEIEIYLPTARALARLRVAVEIEKLNHSQFD